MRAALAAARAFLIAPIPKDEIMLLKNLGSEYSSYRARSWRLVPFVF